MQTRAMLHGLINKEVEAGIAPGRILIGGFSQARPPYTCVSKYRASKCIRIYSTAALTGVCF